MCISPRLCLFSLDMCNEDGLYIYIDERAPERINVTVVCLNRNVAGLWQRASGGGEAHGVRCGARERERERGSERVCGMMFLQAINRCGYSVVETFMYQS